MPKRAPSSRGPDRRKARRRARELRVQTQAPAAPGRPAWGDLLVPTRWVNTIAAILLLPVCWISLAAFFSLLAESAVKRGGWQSESYWFFGTGLAASLVAFAGFRRQLLLIYVTLHEFTHAIWVVLFGGKVRQILLADDGGEIHVSKSNFLIALAPYFFPLPVLGLLALRLAVGAVADLSGAERWFWGLMGAAWGFHAAYTLWMLPREQSDLTEHGVFFSAVIILLMNLLLLTGIVCLADPAIGWRDAAREWVLQGVALTDKLAELLPRLR